MIPARAVQRAQYSVRIVLAVQQEKAVQQESAMESEGADPKRRCLASLAGIAAAGVLVAAIPLCAAGREPFVSWYYVICWYAFIAVLDAVLVLCGGGSFILWRRRAWGVFFFPALVFWSAVLWFFFEVVNFRIANWYYVYVTDVPWEQAVSAALSFGTVLPALFLIEAVLERAGVFSKTSCRPLRLGPNGDRAVVAAGVLCMALPMIWPRVFFPLVWVGLALLPAPLNRRRLESSLLGDLAKGRPGRLLRILLAGLLCGLVWEFLNSFARIRWIYTVPFLEDVKIFEMPPLGFLGFPPFAVECVTVYGFLVAFGLAPACGAFRRAREARPLPRLPIAAVWLLAAAGMWFALQGMLHFNVDSRTPRLDDLGLSEPVARFARDCGMDDAFELDRALRDPLVRELLAREGADVKTAAGLAGLAVFRGIGAQHARSLSLLGVKDSADLRGRDPVELARALNALEGGARPVGVSRVKVWIKAAR